MQARSRHQVLKALDRVVASASAYLSALDENLSDGDQTVHQVLSHLVFWHREHATVIRAWANGRRPKLRIGKYRELNTLAYQEFKDVPMQTLARRLSYWQRILNDVARGMPATEIRFAFRQGSKPQELDYWLPRIHAHVEGHLIRLERVERKKQKALRVT